MGKKHWLWIFTLAAIFLGLYFAKNQKIPAGDYIPDEEKAETSIHKSRFYDEKTFLEGVEQSKGSTKAGYEIKGGIIPHDLFPGFIIADFFKKLSFQNPKTIIMIGPNHYEKGNFKALSSIYSWETPYGTLNPERDFIDVLLSKNLLQIDEEVLPYDHAVSAILPFIKYYISNAKVVPVLLKRGFSENESDILASEIAGMVDEGTVIIASVDFSHYLTGEEAKKKDEITLKIMQDFDYPKLYPLNNDYMDSPPSIGVLLKVMQKLGSTNSKILFHTNSGELQKNSGIETTSYFSITYYDK